MIIIIVDKDTKKHFKMYTKINKNAFLEALLKKLTKYLEFNNFDLLFS
jgi:hypothetical protein